MAGEEEIDPEILKQLIEQGLSADDLGVGGMDLNESDVVFHGIELPNDRVQEEEPEIEGFQPDNHHENEPQQRD